MAAVEAVTPALAGALQRGRERFNARFAQARATGTGVDAEAFLQHLRDVVAPLADAVERVMPDRVDAAVTEAYDLSLELMAAGLLGAQSRHPAIVDGWRRVVPAAAWRLAETPRATLAAVTNALYNLSLHDGARPQQWVEEMTRLAPQLPDLASFRAAGHVIAWRSGMAQHRPSALASCARLSAPLAVRALGVGNADPARLSVALERLRSDPWLTPEKAFAAPAAKSLAVVRAVGAFRGFGGPFLKPPHVFAADGAALIAADPAGHWAIMADVFGSALLPLASPPARREPSREEETKFQAAKLRFEGLAGATSFAADATTLAVTIDQSHEIFLVGMQ